MQLIKMFLKNSKYEDKLGLDKVQVQVKILKIKYQMLEYCLLTLLLIQKSENLKKNPDHANYITTTKFNKFSGKIFNAKVKQTRLPTKQDLATTEQCTIEKKGKITMFFINKSHQTD